MAKQAARKEKIEEALRLLDEAADETRNDISELIKDKYQNLEKTVSRIEPAIRHGLREVREKTVETVEKGTKAVDESVHESPWAYIGGTALAGLAIGFLLGKKI